MTTINNIDIKQILEQFPDCITNGVKLRAILIDTYPDAPKAITNTLAIIVNSGIAKEIKSNSNITELEKSRWKKKLEDDYGLSEKVIESCLNLFLYNSTASQKSGSGNKRKTTDNAKSTATISNKTTNSTKSTNSASNGVSSRQGISNATVGSIIKFGSYWQGKSTGEGKSPIKWRVLAKDGNKALVISEYALDCKQYHSSYTDIAWERCTLRGWLNNDFLNNAFTTEELQAIQSTYVTADRNPEYRTNLGNPTTDNVFLLSIGEAKKYFRSDEDRKCVPTAYAKANLGWTSSVNTKKGEPTCWWWLRSPGNNPYSAAYVYSNGDIDCSGEYVDLDSGCVRPALWIELPKVECGT